MHIAVLSANPPEANPYIRLFRDGLAAAGLDARLVVAPGDDGLPAEARDADVLHLHWLELWGRPSYYNLASLTRWGAIGRSLRRGLAPVINRPALFTWRRRRFLDRFFASLEDYKAAGGRLVYTVHNLGQHEGEASAVEDAALQRLLGLADAVHVHSQSMAGELQARVPRPGGFRIVTASDLQDNPEINASRQNPSDLPLIVIPHGSYIGAYPNTVSRDEARARLEVSPRSFVYLFLGLIRPYKGLEDLLPAFRRLNDPDALLLVAGQSRPPDYAAHLADLAATDPRVRWHGRFVPDAEVQLWMNAADVVVLPYRRVHTSGAALLAFSFAKPVLAPALPAFAELMGDAPRLGLLYDPAAPDALLDALRTVRTVDWQAHQPAILEWVRQFDWPTIGQQFAGLYKHVIASSRAENSPQRR